MMASSKEKSLSSSSYGKGISFETEFFRRQQTLFQEVDGATIAYRKIGDGPALILLHGWPFSGLTFRKLIPHLSNRFTCYAIDVPGAGDTRWHDGTDFRFAAQAQSLRTFIDRLGIESYSVLAHDTGATLARLLALADPDRIQKLILLNTEIPGHRPPWIPLYGHLLGVPLSARVFALLFRSQTFVRSSLGFGGCFADLSLLNDDFAACFIEPLVESAVRLEGLRRYLRGFDWSLVDHFAKRHSEITAPVLMIWGEDDPTFPIGAARAMASQFPNCRRVTAIPRAKLLVHEEQPEAVSSEARSFLDA